MKLRDILGKLAKVVADEAQRNPDFEKRLCETLGIGEVRGIPAKKKTAAKTRTARRRQPAAIDPTALVYQGEAVLRARLAGLSLDQLKDIVAQYGMGLAEHFTIAGGDFAHGRLDLQPDVGRGGGQLGG